jgi:hypothetical protein
MRLPSSALRALAGPLSLAVLLSAGNALAQAADAPGAAPGYVGDAPGQPGAPEVPDDLARLVLETARPPVKPAEKGVLRFQVHGEYQLRYEHLSTLPLDASATVAIAKPGATSDPLGQNDFVAHWLRVTPRFQISDKVEVVGQIDVLTGVVGGDLAHDVSADQTPRDTLDGLSNVQPRWLYADYKSKIGLFRVGQQPSHWGMGLVANDGDHPSLFGDYRYGDIVERVLFATRPGGAKSPLTVAIAGDVVFRDQYAILTHGDDAYQGVAAATLGDEKNNNEIGVYGVYRHQTRSRTSDSALFPYDDVIDVGIIDVAGKFAAPVPGTSAFVFGAGEAAAIVGSTNAERTAAQALARARTQVRQFGGAIQLGVVHVAHKSASAPKPDGRSSRATGAGDAAAKAAFGDVVGQIEVGYATGDSNPNDDVEHRFTFNPNHKVGLLLFDEVMRFQTARAATAAQNPLLANGARPTPGADLLPSNGGVIGAQYINPTVIVRPRRWLDLKAGVVVAQATADVVDPYRLATQGAYVNYQGGDPKRHDLGVELDGGVETRWRLDYGLMLMLGAQAGVLFPGGALADAMGNAMKTPWITVVRAGLLF